MKSDNALILSPINSVVLLFNPTRNTLTKGTVIGVVRVSQTMVIFTISLLEPSSKIIPMCMQCWIV